MPCNVVGAQRPAGVVPAPYPAQRARQGKGGDLGVARCNRAFGYALANQLAELPVNSGLHAPELALAFRWQGVFTHTDHAHAKVHGDNFCVFVHGGDQFVDCTSACCTDLGDGILNHGQADTHAFIKNFLLTFDVVVKRWLGHVQPFGYFIKRGGQVTFFIKNLRRHAQNSLPLVDTVFPPFRRGCPRRNQLASSQNAYVPVSLKKPVREWNLEKATISGTAPRFQLNRSCRCWRGAPSWWL